MNMEVYGQEKTKRISLKVTDVSVLQALHEVNRLCDNLVMFRSEEIMDPNHSGHEKQTRARGRERMFERNVPRMRGKKR